MCTRACSKKSRGSKSMSHIAAGLWETATDDQGWCFQLTSKNHFDISLPLLPKAAQGGKPPAQDYLNYLLGIVNWCFFPPQSPSDSPKITVTPWTPPPCPSLAVLQHTSWWDALGWEHYGVCPGCCCPWPILLGYSTGYVLCRLPSLH